ncbi:hypothetical protein [Streptomyces finlayi]|nr:hypothetical protein [Streptomyces finlayi]
MPEAQTETPAAQGAGKHRGGAAQSEEPTVPAQGRHRRDPGAGGQED